MLHELHLLIINDSFLLWVEFLSLLHKNILTDFYMLLVGLFVEFPSAGRTFFQIRRSSIIISDFICLILECCLTIFSHCCWNYIVRSFLRIRTFISLGNECFSEIRVLRLSRSLLLLLGRYVSLISTSCILYILSLYFAILSDHISFISFPSMLWLLRLHTIPLPSGQFSLEKFEVSLRSEEISLVIVIHGHFVDHRLRFKKVVNLTRGWLYSVFTSGLLISHHVQICILADSRSALRSLVGRRTLRVHVLPWVKLLGLCDHIFLLISTKVIVIDDGICIHFIANLLLLLIYHLLLLLLLILSQKPWIRSGVWACWLSRLLLLIWEVLGVIRLLRHLLILLRILILILLMILSLGASLLIIIHLLFKFQIPTYL